MEKQKCRLNCTVKLYNNPLNGPDRANTTVQIFILIMKQQTNDGFKRMKTSNADECIRNKYLVDK